MRRFLTSFTRLALSRWDVACPLLVLVAVAGIYAQTAGFAFVNYDDDGYVGNNATVRAGMTPAALREAFSARQMSDWVPLTAFSHAVDWAMFGAWAGGHHIVNGLLHAAAALFLYGALRRLMEPGTEGRCAFVAAMFAVHPLHVESVAWVAERKDVLSGFFFMLILWDYARYARRGGGLHYAGVVLCLALGLLAKAMLVTVPLLLLLLDVWPLERWRSRGWKALLWEKAPLFALAAAGLAVGLWANGAARELTAQTPLGLRLGNAAVSAVWYLGRTLWPAGLAALYPFPHQGLQGWEVVGAVAALLGISGVAFSPWAWRRAPWLGVGWGWYLLMLLPVSGIVMPGDFARADRYMYLPQIGLGLALAWGAWAGVVRVFQRKARVLARALGGVVLLVWAGVAWHQTAFWKDSGALWRRTLACTTGNAVAHNGLGDFLSSEGHTEEAIAEYEAALQVRPGYARAHNNLGVERLREGRVEDAIAQFQAALKAEPDSAEAQNNLGGALLKAGRLEEGVEHLRAALKLKSDDPGGWMNLGRGLLRLGQTAEAFDCLDRALRTMEPNAPGELEAGFALFKLGRVKEARMRFAKAVRITPGLAQGHYNLGYTLEQLGQWEKARAEHAEAVRLEPNYAMAWYHLGAAQIHLGEESAGVRNLQRAAQLEPRSPEICLALAWALATCSDLALRNGVVAERWAHQGLALRGDADAEGLRILAAALAERGQFAEARETARRVVIAAQTAGDGAMAEQVKGDLAWYEKDKALPDGK